MRTLQEIENCPKAILNAADVAGYLCCDPHDIRVAAHQAPELLGFPVCVTGIRVRIPRDGFVRWAKGLQEARPT